MTFADHLRAIAERLDEAERLRVSALDDLAALTVDSIEQPASQAPAESGGAGVDSGPVEAPAPSARIEAPGLATAGGRTGPRRPAASGSPAPAIAGAVRDGRRPTRSESAGSTPAPRSITTVACPECDWTGKAAGLGVHRRHRHGHRGTRSTPAERLAAREEKRAIPSVPRSGAPATGVIRKGEEWFLCSRCDQRFRSREGQMLHMREGHPPESRGPIPVGRPAALVPGGGIDD